MNRQDQARCDRKTRSTPCSCWLCSPKSRKRKHTRRRLEIEKVEQVGTSSTVAPWSEVVHIDYQTGPRGGRTWWLTLSCGHGKAVAIPKLKRDVRKVFAPVRDAPRRVRCIFCESAAE